VISGNGIPRASFAAMKAKGYLNREASIVVFVVDDVLVAQRIRSYNITPWAN
jgi:hypothetical protein